MSDVMKVLDETIEDGVRARRFDLQVEGDVVPGMHWVPEAEAGPQPTVCIGHGGFQHKMYGNVPQLAIQLVRNLGLGVVALDAPEHGDRVTDPDAAAKALERLQRRGSDGRLPKLDPKVAAGMAERAVRHVGEWRALLDELQRDDRYAAGPFGWWGVSMGTSHGVPLTATDSRIAAAVFGLNALAPGNEVFGQQAAAITIPVLFLVQSDDELMTRDAALALWDAFGSKEKTLHLNPGGHVKVPKFERQASEDFFRRHLLGGGATRD